MLQDAELPTLAHATDDNRKRAYADATLRRDRQMQSLDETRAARIVKISRDYDLARDPGRSHRRDRAMRHLARTYERRSLRIRAQWITATAAADAAWRP